MSIVVQRRHLVAREHRARFEQLSAEGVWPALLQFGSRMLAYGSWPFGGPDDGVVTHTAYEGFEHWLATRSDFSGARGALLQEEALQAPAQMLLHAAEARAALTSGSEARVIEVDDEVCDLGVHYRRGEAPPAAPPLTLGRGSVISERTYQLAYGGQGEFLRLSQTHVWPWLEQQGVRMVAYGHDPLGPSDEVVTLFAFRSLLDWHRLSRPTEERATAEVERAWHRRSALIRRHRGRLLLVETDFGAQGAP